jgi:hypothetical protein
MQYNPLTDYNQTMGLKKFQKWRPYEVAQSSKCIGNDGVADVLLRLWSVHNKRREDC